MDKNYFIKLTTNLYRLTLLFPKKEPLRYKVRGLADEILGNCVLVLGGSPSQSKNLILETKKDLEILDSYLELAKSQNWVSPFDVLEIQKEYSKIRQQMAELIVLDSGQKKIPIYEDGITIGARSFPSDSEDFIEAEKEKTCLPAGKADREGRQEKILDFLKEKGKAQVGEIKTIFPKVTKRTLRRDFESLLKQGIVERVGEKNNTFYQLPSSAKPSEVRDETKFQRAKGRT